MSKQLAELCTLLVEDIYGELPSRLYATLIDHTRMTLDQIRFKLRISPRIIKNGLAVLVQHNLVAYFCADVGRSTYYQANVAQAYNIIRSGKYVEVVRKRLGDDAVTAYEWIQRLGHTSIDRILDAEAKDVKDYNAALDKQEADERSRIEAAAASAPEEEHANGEPKVNGVNNVNGATNGHHDGHENKDKDNSQKPKIVPRPRRSFTDKERNALRQALDRLIAGGFVEQFRFVNTLSNLDVNSLIEDGVKANDPKFNGILTPKNQAMFEAAVSQMKQKIFNHEQDLINPFAKHWDATEPLIARTFGRRPRPVQGDSEEELAPPAKRRRTEKNAPLDTYQEQTETQTKRSQNKRSKLRENGAEDEASERPAKRAKTGATEHAETTEGHDEFELVETVRPTITELEKKRIKATQENLYHTYAAKFNVSMRNDALVEACQRWLGHNAAKTFGVVLEIMEKQMHQCYNLFEMDPNAENTSIFDAPEVLTKDVAAAMDNETLASLAPRAAMKDAPKDMSKKDKGKGKEGERAREKDMVAAEYKATELVPPATGERTHPKSVGRAENSQIHNVARQMSILAAEPHKLIVKSSHTNDRSSQAWKVDFHALVHKMIQSEIENIVQLRFGSEATKIIRILHGVGRLDEKQLSTIGLIHSRMVRSSLTKMQVAGFVDAQEVPRDATRQTNRTFFLWFYDQDRCRQLIINDAYQGMARLLQRARTERDDIRILLEKSQRSDVQGREEEYLTQSERDALSQWNAKEDKILAQLNRQDSIVTMFRDFLPMKTDKPVKT